MLHGFSGHPEDWAETVARLPADAQVIAEPILGHRGHDEAERSSTIFDDEVDRLATRLSTPVHAVGYSLGGRLVLGLLKRHPAKIARATLIGSQPGLRTEAERAQRRIADGAWIDLLLTGGIERFADAWEKQAVLASQLELSGDLIGPVRARRRAHHPRGLATAMRALGLGSMPDLWPSLAAVDVPVTLMYGERDAKFGALAREMAAALRDARVVVVPGADHNPVLTRPSVIAEVLST
jgi:2-succinyl-6-hydroxy-2,4-cyclohexadiene-1-carboxylate synthase